MLQVVYNTKMEIDRIIEDAKAAKRKETLDAYREVIQILRGKGYSWRDISDFLIERGVRVDHTKVYRFAKKIEKTKGKNMKIITSEQYEDALNSIEINDAQKEMLKVHFKALNRSISYTELANAAGYDDYEVANSQYGRLGRKIGEAVGFDFVDAENRPGEKFYSSSIGQPNTYTEGDFQLVMHHELAKAIENMKLFHVES